MPTCATLPLYTSLSSHRSCKGSPDRSSPTTDTTGPDAEHEVHTNFTPSRTLLPTPIKLPLALYFPTWPDFSSPRHRLFVFWLVVSSIIFKSRILNHRTITVCPFISDYNALDYDCSAACPYVCTLRARKRRPHTPHATSVRSTTQARRPRRRWSTSKLTEHRWNFSFKP